MVCRAANIAIDDAMILPQQAHPGLDSIFGKDSHPVPVASDFFDKKCALGYAC
jgi:hypothetical protein